jgi:hypothetical protein
MGDMQNDIMVQKDITFIMHRTVEKWRTWYTEPMPNIGERREGRGVERDGEKREVKKIAGEERGGEESRERIDFSIDRDAFEAKFIAHNILDEIVTKRK